MKLSIKAGSTSQSITVFILDATSGTGAGLTGLVYNSAGLTARYTHSGTYATSTAITLATLAAITSSWSSGGFKEVDAATMPGMYRFDIPNACVQDSKGQSVVLMLYGAANMVPVTIEIEIRGASFGAVDANVTQIDGQATSGNNATLKLKSLDIQSDSYLVNAVNVVGGINPNSGQRGGNGIRVVGGNGDSHGYGIYVAPSPTGSGSSPAVLLDGSVGGCYGLQITGKSVPPVLLQRLDSGSVVIQTYNSSYATGDIDANISGYIGSVVTLRPVKNTGYNNFMFPMFDASTKSPKSGLSVTAERAIDGNPFSLCSTAVAELGNGVYRINLSASDMNGDKIMFRFTATGADDQLIEVFTQG